MGQHTTHNAEESQNLAAGFVAGLDTMPRPASATLVVLSGELGAGKTTFVQGVAQALGISESVTSPTFVILKIYVLQNQTFERLVHIDAYRLESGKDLAVLGFDDLLRDPGNLIFIEWPEHVVEVLPKERINVRFEIMGETEREVEISNL